MALEQILARLLKTKLLGQVAGNNLTGCRGAVVDWVELRDILRQEERFKLAAVFDPLEDLFVEVEVLAVGDLYISSLLI